MSTTLTGEPQPKANGKGTHSERRRVGARYGVHPSTVWRAVRDGRLQYIVVGRRKLILPPVVQGENSSANPPRGKKMRP